MLSGLNNATLSLGPENSCSDGKIWLSNLISKWSAYNDRLAKADVDAPVLLIIGDVLIN